jgi:hypothetical protein
VGDLFYATYSCLLPSGRDFLILTISRLPLLIISFFDKILIKRTTNLGCLSCQ